MRSSAGRGRRKLALSDTGTPFLQWGRGGMQCVSGCRIKQHCPQRFCIVLPSVERSFTVREVKDPCPSTVGCRGRGKMACISLCQGRDVSASGSFLGEKGRLQRSPMRGRAGFPISKRRSRATAIFYSPSNKRNFIAKEARGAALVRSAAGVEEGGSPSSLQKEKSRSRQVAR